MMTKTLPQLVAEDLLNSLGLPHLTPDWSKVPENNTWEKMIPHPVTNVKFQLKVTNDQITAKLGRKHFRRTFSPHELAKPNQQMIEAVSEDLQIDLAL